MHTDSQSSRTSASRCRCSRSVSSNRPPGAESRASGEIRGSPAPGAKLPNPAVAHKPGHQGPVGPRLDGMAPGGVPIPIALNTFVRPGAGLTAGSESPRRHRWSLIIAVLALWACGDDPTAAAPGCGQAPPLVLEFPRHERLEAGDRTFRGAYIDDFSLVLDAPLDVEITMFAREFDPFLYLFDERRRVVAQAFAPDSGAAGEEVAVTVRRSLPAGCHLVGATAWAPGATGAYTVLVEPVDPEDS